jgi:hypothetical protein
MKSFSAKLALAVAAAALLTTAAYAQIVQPGVACVGGRGIGYYPNPVAYGDAASNIESGGEFTLDRGYPGCFTYLGE